MKSPNRIFSFLFALAGAAGWGHAPRAGDFTQPPPPAPRMALPPLHETTVEGSFDPGIDFLRSFTPPSRTFTLAAPVGPVEIAISPLSSIPSLRPRQGAGHDLFRAPALFSAPMPVGSGARALGFSGAFTAIAEDATAASWNPAGLSNLEHPEASAVYRYRVVHNRHRSDDPRLEVGTDQYESDGLNYASVAVPLPAAWTPVNMVFSLNQQEAWDFTHAFHSATRESGVQSIRRQAEGVARARQTDRFLFEGGRVEFEVLSDITTRSTSELSQTVRTDLESLLRFRQQGVIEATTPALSVELNPNLRIGGALNFHQDSPWPGREIRSTTRVDYRSTATSRATITNTQTTDVRYQTSGLLHLPGFGDLFPPEEVPLPGESGSLPRFTDREVLRESRTVVTEGLYEETSRYDDLEGVNATFGVLASFGGRLSLGASVDLPWTAEADETRAVRRRAVTRDAAGRETGRSESLELETRDAEFEFPLFWNAGAMWRWSPNAFSSLEVGQTLWSDFRFSSGGAEFNPLDGSPAGEDRIDDTWNARVGTEYLVVRRGWEIPLRAGLVYEERPAVGSPDAYRGFSVGTGVGKEYQPKKRVLFDIAYSYLEADDVQTVLPSEPALRTDTRQHLVYASIIIHL